MHGQAQGWHADTAELLAGCSPTATKDPIALLHQFELIPQKNDIPHSEALHYISGGSFSPSSSRQVVKSSSRQGCSKFPRLSGVEKRERIKVFGQLFSKRLSLLMKSISAS